MSRLGIIDECHKSLTKSYSLDFEQSEACDQKFRKKWSFLQVYIEVEGRVDLQKPNRNLIDECHKSLTKSYSSDCEQSEACNQKFRKKWSLPQVYVEVEGRVDVGKPNRNLVD